MSCGLNYLVIIAANNMHVPFYICRSHDLLYPMIVAITHCRVCSQMYITFLLKMQDTSFKMHHICATTPLLTNRGQPCMYLVFCQNNGFLLNNFKHADCTPFIYHKHYLTLAWKAYICSALDFSEFCTRFYF